jgi:hypothetical protein
VIASWVCSAADWLAIVDPMPLLDAREVSVCFYEACMKKTRNGRDDLKLANSWRIDTEE